MDTMGWKVLKYNKISNLRPVLTCQSGQIRKKKQNWEEERNILDGFTLQCRGDELIKRVGNWQNANQAILFGFFTYDWASQAVPLKEVVPTVDGKGTVRYNITSKYPCYYGLGGESVNPSLRFYVYDLFEEIDMAGEYFLDRTPGAEKLYFYKLIAF